MDRTEPLGHFDIIIVGAGIAGQALASGLEECKVLMIEAGEAAQPHRIIEAKKSQQAIAEDKYRAFGVGGTSTIWGGGLVPFSDLDLLSWPKSVRQEIHHYLPSALQFFTKSPKIADRVKRYWEAKLIPAQPGPPTCQALFQLRKEDLLVDLGNSSSGKRVLLNNHWVEYISPKSSIRKHAEVAIKRKDGKLFSATSEAVVIACGGIESLAMISRSPQIDSMFAKNNNYRGFSMHVSGLVGVAKLPKGQNPIECQTLPSEQLLPFLHIASAGIPGHSAFRVNFQPVRYNLLPLIGLKFHGMSLYAEILKNALSGQRSWLINIDGDQRPSQNSNVQIRNGSAHITLSIDDSDLKAIREVQAQTMEYLRKRGGDASFLRKTAKGLVGRSHHLGGLCSISEESHRLTSDLEIGKSSIYVLSTAAFRSFSFANPTLMLAQLAFRMADHLREKYQST